MLFSIIFRTSISFHVWRTFLCYLEGHLILSALAIHMLFQFIKNLSRAAYGLFCSGMSTFSGRSWSFTVNLFPCRGPALNGRFCRRECKQFSIWSRHCPSRALSRMIFLRSQFSMILKNYIKGLFGVSIHFLCCNFLTTNFNLLCLIFLHSDVFMIVGISLKTHYWTI